MATPNYEQIQSFGNVKKELQQAAINEFMRSISSDMTLEEIIYEGARIAVKYRKLGAELGAQWYDLCSRLAGLDVEPAVVEQVDANAVARRTSAAVRESTNPSVKETFNLFLQDEINNSIRITGSANLWRDYERGKAGGKWARVPVGDTCAWCIMLASQGAYYVSKESALGQFPDHYHKGCDCIAVYHADANDIAKYNELNEYKHMYYEADNLRQANSSGKRPYPEDLQRRVTLAREQHKAKQAEAEKRGETVPKWTKYNEDLIVMRYQFGLK